MPLAITIIFSSEQKKYLSLVVESALPWWCNLTLVTIQNRHNRNVGEQIAHNKRKDVRNCHNRGTKQSMHHLMLLHVFI